MKKNWAKINMRRLGNTAYRDEQVELYKKLKSENPRDIILMEFPIDGIAIADVANCSKKIVYRCMGPIHRDKRQSLKDQRQKELLEERLWTVKDKWYGI